MLGYLRGAVPWALLLTGAALVPALIVVVTWDNWTFWPMQGTAVGLLAGVTAWCLDEPAAAVVDTQPRGLPWRTAARGIPVTVLLVVWSATVWWARSSFFGQAPVVWLQGAAAILIALAWVTWRRSVGEATPGQRFALGAVVVTIGWALLHPWRDQLPIFPYATTPARVWARSAQLWAGAGVGALAVLAAALSGRLTRRRRRDGAAAHRSRAARCQASRRRRAPACRACPRSG